jgi:hypothetical protein
MMNGHPMMHAAGAEGELLLIIVIVVVLALASAAVALRARHPSTATPSHATDRMLASDRARERAVAVLSRAYASGRLTGEDLERRTELAFIARTRGELRELIADIPGDVKRR